jgi:Cu(I)/Ag(I) efflux system membrane fusion protein
VIRTGKVERVILLVGEGRFQAAKVRTGAEADGMVEVIEGLEPGEVVVVSGQFLIDSESSFQGATLRVFSGDHELDHGSMNSVEHEGPP